MRDLRTERGGLFVWLFTCLCARFLCFLDDLVFLLDPLQGSSLQVEILSIYMFVCLSVITSYSLHYSDSKLTQHPPVDISHTTSPTVSNVPHPCLPCLPVNWSPFPVNWSPNEQDHITDLFFQLGVELCVNLTFFLSASLHCENAI